MTALLEAAEHGHLPVVRMLVEVYGVDVFQKTKVYQININFAYSLLSSAVRSSNTPLEKEHKLIDIVFVSVT